MLTLAQQTPSLEAFENLVGSTWISEGIQLNGQEGKTEKEFSYGLEESLIKVKTYTTLNPDTGEYGLRNEGVRGYNASTNELYFYEFDIYGGLFSGKVIIEDKNIHYEYEYDGQTIRDSWIFEDQDSYNFSVNQMENGEIVKVIYESVFKRSKTESKE